jgi:transposase InsO family protein
VALQFRASVSRPSYFPRVACPSSIVFWSQRDRRPPAPLFDDFSRYIIAWKLCTTMKAEDVTATLEMALEAAALDKARVLLGQGCCPTTAPHTSRGTWRNG